jgi:hypothetical protein
MTQRRAPFRTMPPRLLSFFSDIERSIEADQPSSPEGEWKSRRTVNYSLGIARLELGMVPSGSAEERKGTILLQCYQLADSSPCLKAALSWAGIEGIVTRSIYSKPEMSWTSEARKIAAEWLGGPPPAMDKPSFLSEAAETIMPIAAAVSA